MTKDLPQNSQSIDLVSVKKKRGPKPMLINSDVDAAKPVKPLDGQFGISRAQLASLFNRTGRGINCRLDIPLLTKEDLKWAAKTFFDLSKALNELAFVDARSDIWLVLAARSNFEYARSQLGITNKKKDATKAFQKAIKDEYKKVYR